MARVRSPSREDAISATVFPRQVGKSFNFPRSSGEATLFDIQVLSTLLIRPCENAFRWREEGGRKEGEEDASGISNARRDTFQFHAR